jgi:hypothetical protein
MANRVCHPLALYELFAMSNEQRKEQDALSGGLFISSSVGLSSHILPARWHVVLSLSILPLGTRMTCDHSS